MAKPIAEKNLLELSQSIRSARSRKGWTLEQLSHELWERGFPTAQNKLWRLENKPPKRIDSELLLWLEKVLGVELFGSGEKQQVFIEDVLEILDGFADPAGEVAPPIVPRSGGLQQIHEKVAALARAVAR